MLQKNKIPLFFFISLGLHSLIFNMLSKIQISSQNYLPKTFSRLSVTLLTYPHVLEKKQTSKVTHTTSIQSRKIETLLNHPATELHLSSNRPTDTTTHLSFNTETHTKPVNQSIHNTKYWAKQFSNLPESPLHSSLYKKGLSSKPQTDTQKLGKEMAQSIRTDCKNAYNHMGLLAIPSLLFDLTKENGCQWK